MLTDKQIEQYFEEMENKLLDQNNFLNVILASSWVKTFPHKPGVYIAVENERIVYIGETGSIRGRMRDLLDSRHHTLRRNIGELNFSDKKGYEKATTKKKFPLHIEKIVEKYISENIKISFVPTKIGRKEIEERLIHNYKPKYNFKGQRITN